MTAMLSGNHTSRLAAACLEPVGRDEAGGFAGFHSGQAGEHVGKVFLGIDAQAAAVLHDGVEDGTLLSRLLIAQEEPVFRTKLGRANRVFYADMLIMRTSFAQ